MKRFTSTQLNSSVKFLRNLCSSIEIPKQNIIDERNPKQIPELCHLELINYEKDKTYFLRYTKFGFVFSNKAKVFGPVVAIHNQFFSWKVNDIKDVCEETLLLASIIEPKLDLIIIGKGATFHPADFSRLYELSKKMKINFEILSTPEAITLFNFLNYEERHVAAFVLPIKETKLDPLISEEINRRRLLRNVNILENSIPTGEPNLDLIGNNPLYDEIGKLYKSLVDEVKKEEEELIHNKYKPQLTNSSVQQEKIDKKEDYQSVQAIESKESGEEQLNKYLKGNDYKIVSKPTVKKEKEKKDDTKNDNDKI